MQGIEADAVDQFGRSFDVPDGEIAALVQLERANLVEPAERPCGFDGLSHVAAQAGEVVVLDEDAVGEVEAVVRDAQLALPAACAILIVHTFTDWAMASVADTFPMPRLPSWLVKVFPPTS